MTSEHTLGSHVVAEASAEEMDRQWANIEARVGVRPRRRRIYALSLLLACTGAAAVWVLLPRYLSAPERIFVTQSAPMQFSLDDGSQLQLSPASDVRWVDRRKSSDVRLQILRGNARFEIRHDPRRRFQVTAADVDVTVTGTVFSVELAHEGQAARVSVERGEVEVRPRGQMRLLARLHAGQSWAASPDAFAERAPETAKQLPAVTAPMAPAGDSPSAPAAVAPKAPEPVPPVARASTSAPKVAQSPAFHRPTDTNPRSLLEQANAARRSGDVAQAAVLLEMLRARYPHDGRAGLASFELGRLRMDVLGDLPGAVQALKQSIALEPSGVFREDAEACLANAYARMHDRARCEQARAAYLGHYPEGTHAAAMAALRCQAP